jgi:hypothetical protein
VTFFGIPPATYMESCRIFGAYTPPLKLAWQALQHDPLAVQLTAAGYNTQPMLIAIEAVLLSFEHCTACDTGWMEAYRDLLSKIEGAGLSVLRLATPYACNNPACSSVSGPSELLLVNGRSCVCGGCRVAHYCSRACQRQH